MLDPQPLDDPTAQPQTYLRHAPPALPTEPVRGTERTTVAVIGGGFTGLSTALHLRMAGVPVTVIEAKAAAWGASGRNFGQLVPYAKHDHTHLRAHFGAETGDRLSDWIGAGPDYVYGLIERFDMPCQPKRVGLLFGAQSRAAERLLSARAAHLQRQGVAARWLDRAEAAAAIGSEHYFGALHEPRGGTINPLAYCRGLQAAATQLGAVVRTNTRVNALERAGNQWRVVCWEGEVLADTVVLATNAYTTKGLWPGLRESIIPMRAYQVVTKPLTENLRRSVLPSGQPLTDMRRLFSGVRLHDDGRLQVSVDGPAFTIGASPFGQQAARRIGALFPQLGTPEWDDTWSGWVAMTTDMYPHLHELAPGLWSGLGYSGRGIVLTTLMGRELAARISGQGEPVFPVTPLKSIGVKRIAVPLVGALMRYYRLRDRLDDRPGR